MLAKLYGNCAHGKNQSKIMDGEKSCENLHMQKIGRNSTPEKKSPGFLNKGNCGENLVMSKIHANSANVKNQSNIMDGEKSIEHHGR